ncbi:MAG: hypothetical protein ACK4Q5_06045 [Saprospiraceae bacterium]
MSASLKLSTLTSKLGAYFRTNNGVFMPRVAQGLDILKHVSIKQVKDELPLITIGGPSLVRPSLRDNAWNPTADAIEYIPRILKVRPCKVDLSIVPAELWATYLGEQAKRGASNQQAIPMEAFMFQYIVERTAEDVGTKAIFGGTYNASGTTPADIFDGWLKIVTDEITGGGIAAGQVTSGAAITSSNAYDQVLLVYKKVPAALRGKKLKCFMSYATFDAFNEDYGSQFTAAPYNMTYEKAMLPGTNVELVPSAEMGSSSRIIITTPDNLVLGVDMLSDHEHINLQQNRRGLDLMIDFSMGVQIADTRLIFCNNQA